MKYFLIETDERNRIPYGINSNRELDIRLLNREQIDTLPQWNMVNMSLPMEVFFPDIISKPFLLMSDICIKTAMMYQKDIIYKGIKLWNRESGINVTYFAAVLEELECMSDQTQYNSVGNRIVKLVLDRNKIGSNVVFKIKGYDGSGFIGRLDFVESILRRGTRGIRLEEVDVEE